MITQNFKNASGKYPVTTETLEALQNQAKFYDSLLSMFFTSLLEWSVHTNRPVIISEPTSRRPGAILWSYKIYEWRGKSSDTRIKPYTDTVQQVVNGEVFTSTDEYFASCAAPDGYLTSQMEQFQNGGKESLIKKFKDAILPIGSVIIWSGKPSEIPSGWEFYAELSSTIPFGSKDEYPESFSTNLSTNPSGRQYKFQGVCFIKKIY